MTQTVLPKLETELVGRNKELQQLKAHLDTAISGRGKLVLIAGEAGVGKTRLVSKLLQSKGAGRRFNG